MNKNYLIMIEARVNIIALYLRMIICDANEITMFSH